MASLSAHLLDYEPDDLDVRIADLIVATHESSDPLTHPKVAEALVLMREKLKMDVVFVSQFGNGRRTFRVVDDARQLKTIFPGHSDPLEESWCQKVVDRRIPEFIKDAGSLIASGEVPRPATPIGTHMSTPITLKNGEVYGTLCCFSCEVEEKASETDMRRLTLAAKLLAEELHSAGLGKELELEPLDSRPGGSGAKPGQHAACLRSG